MKNNLYYLISLCLSTLVFSQNGKVGIGTNSPQQVLHVDASKNTIIGTPSTNISDDIVITPQGYMGIGTLTPSKRLEINSTTNGAIKIVDGTQQQNAFLLSDANGVGSWYVQGSIKQIVLGNWQNIPTITSDNSGGTKYIFVSINLTPGVWMVNFGGTFKMNDVTTPYWLHIYLSDSEIGRTNSTFDFLGSGGSNTGYAGLMIANKTSGVGNANLISGSSIIKVKQNTTIKVLVENNQSDIAPKRNWNVTNNNWENYFYAVPLDSN